MSTDYGLSSAAPPRPKRDGFLWNPHTAVGGSGSHLYQMYRIAILVQHKLKHESMPIDVRWDLEQRLARTWDYLDLSDGYIPDSKKARRDCLLGEYPDASAKQYRPRLRLVR